MAGKPAGAGRWYGSREWSFTPTLQRVEGWPLGECVRASYATIFDKNIDDIPRFDPGYLNGRDQRTAERNWLATMGYELEEITTSADDQLPQEVLDSVPPCLHLISGRSPRGFGHRCVGWRGQVVHDPHPSRAGLVTVYSIGLLVPLS